MASAALTEALAPVEDQPSTAVEPAAPRTPIGLLQGEKALEMIAESLPAHMDAATFQRHAITLVKQTPKLMECEAASVAQGIVRGAALGLDPDPALGQMWLVPRKVKTYDPATRKDVWIDVATFQVGYRGLYELAMRTGRVAKVEVRAVHRNDQFRARLGSEGGLDHQPDWFGDRGPVIGWYAYAQLKDGTETFEVLSVAQAQEHRDNFGPKKRDGSVYGPWVDHFDAMAQKTVFIKLAKWLPKSVELAQALDADGTAQRQPIGQAARAGDVIEATHTPIAQPAVTAVASVPDEDPDDDPTPPTGVDTSTGEIDQGGAAPATADDNGDPIETTATSTGGSTDPEQQVHNNRKMWAIVNEIWAGEHADTIDGRRKGAISAVTKGRTESSKELAPPEWFDLFDALDLIKNGAMELRQRATGEWEIKAPPASRRRAS